MPTYHLRPCVSMRVYARVLVSLVAVLVAGTLQLSTASAQKLGVTGATPEETIAAAYATSGSMHPYVGACTSTADADGSGNLCSRFAVARESDGMAAYMVAEVPELTGMWFFLAPVDGGWRLVSVEHALCTDDPRTPPFP
ncbi:MAG: hypothetical protein U0893_10030 [Chloroflexota bacterium]